MRDMEGDESKSSSMWCTISDLHPTKMKMNAAMKVRFVRIFENTSPKDRNEIFSIEAIIHDSKGDRISLTIPRIFIKKWKALLEEESVYGIKNFMVVHNTAKYKISTHDYKVKFNFETNVKRMVDDFPRKIFQFKPYEEIDKLNAIKDGELFDVIGVLLNKPIARSTRTYNGSQKILMDLILQDIEGKRMTCTLWDDWIVPLSKSSYGGSMTGTEEQDLGLF